MKKYTKTIKGVVVTARNDNNGDYYGSWIVQAGDMLPQGWPKKTFTRKSAMEMAADIATVILPEDSAPCLL